MQITLAITVVAFETDFSGVVSNTRYLEYLERGRYALVQAAGLRLGDIWDAQRIQVVVRRSEVDYLAPARHEDELHLHTAVTEHTGATTTLRHALVRATDGAALLRARQTLAYLNERWRPVRVPDAFRAALAVSPQHDAAAGA